MSASSFSAFALTCALVTSAVSPAHALNILLTNDDGFESAALHAVYQRLEASGHSVIVSAPAYDATAQAGGVSIGRAIEALPTASRGGAAQPGASGIGTLPTDPDVHYVNGSPVTSLLYGLDIVAKQKWSKPPDLVISGINYGLNVGRGWSGSGTIGAAVSAISRGVPAIAVSAAFPLASYSPVQNLKAGDREYDLADFVLRLVIAVELGRTSPEAPLLPRGLGLNVNLPVFAPGTAASLPVKLSQLGTATNGVAVFVANLSRDWAPVSFPLPAAPGIAYLAPDALPADLLRPADTDPSSEHNVVKAGTAAITVIHPSIQASPWNPDSVGSRIVDRLTSAK